MLALIHEYVTFPSFQLRERLYSGFARTPVSRSTLETIGWMEEQFARGVYASSLGDEVDLTMIECELKQIYVSSGLLNKLAEVTGHTENADTLLARIRQQVSRLLADA